jgi:hypothetical protein
MDIKEGQYRSIKRKGVLQKIAIYCKISIREYESVTYFDDILVA